MKLKSKYCHHCIRLISVDKYQCPVCFTEDLAIRELSGKGKVFSYTNIYAAPKKFSASVPYFIILVDLEEGLRVTARYNGKEMEIGKKVVLDTIEDRAYFFKPQEGY